jgi:hypothetical protein
MQEHILCRISENLPWEKERRKNEREKLAWNQAL